MSSLFLPPYLSLSRSTACMPTNRGLLIVAFRCFQVRCCSDNSSSNQTTKSSGDKGKFVDTRIHWGSSTEGWIGVDDSPSSLPAGSYSNLSEGYAEEPDDDTGDEITKEALVDFLLQASGTHYQYLGVSPAADQDEIKTAYRRLSKQYHPDTTSFPLEVAAQKFVRLKEAYNILSSTEERRVYDWMLAQGMTKQQEEQFTWPSKIHPIYKQTGSTRPRHWSERREPVGGAGGRHIPLSAQAQTGLVFDIFAILVSIASIVYASFFKHK